MRWTMNAFVTDCHEQGIGLHPSIVDGGKLDWVFTIKEPSRLFGGIYFASELLGTRPSLDLTEYTAPDTRIDTSRFNESSVATGLADLINSSRAPRHTAITNAERIFASGPVAVGSTCSLFEPNTTSLLDTIALGHRPGCEIFVDSARVPLFIRKGSNYGSDLTLSLDRIAVNNIEHDPLSVMHVRTSTDTYLRKDKLVVPKTIVRPISDITHIAYGRPSGFGLVPDQQAYYFPYMTEGSYDKQRIWDVISTFVARKFSG